MKWITPLLLILFSLSAGSTEAAGMFDDGFKPCGDQPNTLAIVACVDAKTRVWDRRLNAAYAALQRVVDAAQRDPLIPDALSSDCFGPGAPGDGGDALWRAHQFVPSITAGTHDGVVVVPNTVAEKVGPQVGPDLFHWV